MQNKESEIDDERFFLAPKGKIDALSELNATIDALLNETRFDDNSTACKFPARKAWLAQELDIKELPTVECKEYDAIVQRLNPKSVTLVFPAAHINSPASMFGHTFLRINSAYNSKLLSYAVNYAADANPDTENAVIFAIKGLFGGYSGKYSMLPYYDKLKEYRDSEQRDIWEYDLDLNENEIKRMLQHIWELNDTLSYYYFFTENCSYNMLWFLEVARPTLHLRDYFNYQVIPFESVHAANEEGIIKNRFYRPSKRTILLAYEKKIDEKYIDIPAKLIHSEAEIESIVNDKDIDIQQKRYILEASIELLEYNLSKGKIPKERYLTLFHELSKARASLKKGESLYIATPNNPIDGHRAVKTSFGTGIKDGDAATYLGIRPAYHDLSDSNYGYMRGTQIEFLDFELLHYKNQTKIQKATLISIASIAQQSSFFDMLSWRTKLGWDRNMLRDEALFSGTVGAGFSWGNELGYAYIMADPLFYIDKGAKTAIGGSVGFVIDKYDIMSTKFEYTNRLYDSGDNQNIYNLSQNFRTSQNTQIRFEYDYRNRFLKEHKYNEDLFRVSLNYYF